MNLKQKIVVVVMDALLLAELTLAIYLGYRDPGNQTEIFLKTFLPALVVTVGAARLCIHRLETKPS